MLKINNIWIVGSGALGCLYSALLANAGFKVTLFTHTEEQAASINRTGILIKGSKELLVRQKLHAVANTAKHTFQGASTLQNINTLTPQEKSTLNPPELLLVLVKGYSTRAALATLPPLINADTQILTLQNGLGNAQEIAELFPKQLIFCGITYNGATLLETGQVLFASQGDTFIGMQSPEKESTATNAKKLANVFNTAGIHCAVAENINSLLWSKLAVNAGINPLAALTRLNNGELAASNAGRELMCELVQEVVQVASAQGIQLDSADPFAHTLKVAEATARNKASMLQDILAGRRTEIDYISGAVVRYAEQYGIAAPANKRMLQLIKILERST